MPSNDYSVQNIHRYSRKSFKQNRLGAAENYNLVVARDDINTAVSGSSQKDERYTSGTQGCSCDGDPEGELTNILHRKCPVIALAQEQLQKILDQPDCCKEGVLCCRSVFDILQICRETLWNENNCKCGVIVILFCAFIIGLLFGAGTCGVTYRKFNSPIFACIDSYFIPDTYTKIEDTYRSIV